MAKASTRGSLCASLETGAQGFHNGIDLARLAPDCDARHQFPDVAFGFEVVAPVAADGNAADKTPPHELLQRIRNVGSCDAERVSDVFRGERAACQIKQGMDLRDRAVESPGAAHVSPFENETFDCGRKAI